MDESVTCILFSFDRHSVLLIKRRDIPVWVLPGGGIDKGETPEVAACREMVEETGFEVKIVRKVATYTPSNRLSKVTHFFEVAQVSGKPSVGSETREIEFFPVDALPKLMPPPYANWIADAAANHPETLSKPVEGTSYWTLLKLLILHPVLVGRFLLTKIGIHLNTK